MIAAGRSPSLIRYPGGSRGRSPVNEAELQHNPRVIAGTAAGFEGLRRFRSPLLDPFKTLLPVAVEVERVPAERRSAWAEALRARGFLVDDQVDVDRMRVAGSVDRFELLVDVEPDPDPADQDRLADLLRCVGDAVKRHFTVEYRLPHPKGSIDCGRRPLKMAILNVTPDSFSDGGRYLHPERAIERAFELEAQGADVIDIGAESTRPGAAAVSAEEEIERLEPVMRVILDKLGTPVSVDTMKAEVADRFVGQGAAIINDVSGLERDPRIAEVAARHRAVLVINHMRGTPRSMQESPRYDDVLSDVTRSLRERMWRATRAGLPRERIVVDPGIGFGKRLEDNLDLLAHVDQLRSLGCPILLGCSRKSFLGALTGREADDRDAATAATTALAAFRGVAMVRVHEVTETADLLSVLDAIDGRRHLE